MPSDIFGLYHQMRLLPEGITKFICNINECRYNAFLKITGCKGRAATLKNVKKLNCASLPPCEKTTLLHIKRANYVARMWRRADTLIPTGDWNPCDFGWLASNSGLQPEWFCGSSVPAESLASLDSASAKSAHSDSFGSGEEELSEDAWSDYSDADDE